MLHVTFSTSEIKVQNQGHNELKMVCNTVPSLDIHTSNFVFLADVIREICPGQALSIIKVKGQCHSDFQAICDTLPVEDTLKNSI